MAVGLRQEATPAEDFVWGLLRANRLKGLKFRRQHVLHGYIVDFYCHEKRLVIELDGAPHLETEKKAKDSQRDSTLEFKGYKVLRFMNEDVFHDPHAFKAAILKIPFHTPPSPPL
jgi:very-short-patch-repair endonuclease